jgi:hypothetical protein
MTNIIQFPTNSGNEPVEEKPEIHSGKSDSDAREPGEEYHQFRALLVSEMVQLRKEVGEI